MKDARREDMREATVLVLLGLRREYLAQGASPLKHWTQLQDRMRSAARMAVDVPTWVTQISRSLGIGAANAKHAKHVTSLATLIGADSAAWLDLLEEEHAYLIALARLAAQREKESREAKREERRILNTPTDDNDKPLPFD